MHMTRDIAVLCFTSICKNPKDRKEFITVTTEACRDTMVHKLDDAMLIKNKVPDIASVPQGPKEQRRIP